MPFHHIHWPRYTCQRTHLLVGSETLNPDIPFTVCRRPARKVATGMLVLISVDHPYADSTPAQIGPSITIAIGYVIFHVRQCQQNIHFIAAPLDWVKLGPIDTLKFYRQRASFQWSSPPFDTPDIVVHSNRPMTTLIPNIIITATQSEPSLVNIHAGTPTVLLSYNAIFNGNQSESNLN